MVCALAPSSRSATIVCPARSTTTTDVLKPLALHSAIAASAIVFARPSESVFCMTTFCADAAMPSATKKRTFMSPSVGPLVQLQIAHAEFGAKRVLPFSRPVDAVREKAPAGAAERVGRQVADSDRCVHLRVVVRVACGDPHVTGVRLDVLAARDLAD